jgi:mono/diheme cytochrome c family protein
MRTAIVVPVLLLSIAYGAAAQSSKGKAARASQSQWDGVFTDAQAARGEALYVDNCIMCHGTNLAGTVLAPPIAGPAFLGKWNGRPLGLVFEIIQTRMPWNLTGHLSPQQNADLLAYMLKRSDGPSGDKELPASGEALKAVTLHEKRP